MPRVLHMELNSAHFAIAVAGPSSTLPELHEHGVPAQPPPGPYVALLPLQELTDLSISPLAQTNL